VSRIEETVEEATEIHPALRAVTPGHAVRCWMYHDVDGAVIRTEAPPSFRPGASSLTGSEAVDERGATAELGGTGDVDSAAGPA
jgi:hypothetical protein